MGAGKGAALAAALLLAGVLNATAQDRREFDAKIEKWAARQISGRLGDLRGSFALDQHVDAATVHNAFSQPAPKPKRLSPIYRLPQVGEPLPPIVMNDVARQRRGS